MNVKEASKVLGLPEKFTIAELKLAYRQAALKAHPDCGGTAEAFIDIDRAYDSLKYCVSGEKEINLSYWDANFFDLEKKFKKVWLQAYKEAMEECTGLWYSTEIQRFTRAYCYPQDDWFRGVLFEKPTFAIREYYRGFLLKIAPSQRLREEWAIKYYRLEFGFDTPYTFYLPPAKIPAKV